jgi:hypothetical protein
MSFDRQFNDTEAALGLPIDPAHWNELDRRQPFILEGEHGGSWAPDGKLTIGGKGIRDAYQQKITPTVTSGSATVSNIDSNRTFITGVSSANAYLTLQFTADSDGVGRDVMIDSLGPGVTVILRDENNTIMSHGQWTNHDPSTLVLIRIERIDGVWVCTHRSSNAQDLYKMYEADAVQGPDHNPLPAIENWYGPDEGVGGVVFFDLPTGVSGLVRRLRIKRLLPYAQIRFFSNGDYAIQGGYNVGGGGEINVTIEMMYGLGGWRITNVVKNIRPLGELSFSVTSISEDPIAIDTDSYVAMSVNTPVNLQSTTPRFTIKEPLFEHQELRIYFQSLYGVDQAPQIEIRLASTNVIIKNWIFSPYLLPSVVNAPVLQWGGAYPACMRLRVVDGHWIYESLTL